MQRYPIILTAAFLAASLPGCASTPRTDAPPPDAGTGAMLATPTTSELPTFSRVRRSIPARIDVEGQESRIQGDLIPKFAEIKLTPEERAALGKDRKTPDQIVMEDLLAFYRPERGPKHGVAPELAGYYVGYTSAGPPRADVVRADKSAYGVGQALGGYYAGVDSTAREIVSTYQAFVPEIGVYSQTAGWYAGEGGVRTEAAVAPVSVE